MANIFRDDADAVALWRYESSLNDSLQSNNLSVTIGDSPTYDGSAPEGSTSMNATATNDGGFVRISITSPTADFPGLAASGALEFSVAGWIKLNWNTYSEDPAVDDTSVEVLVGSAWGLLFQEQGDPGPSGSYKVILQLRFQSGLIGFEPTISTGRLQNNVWYHITYTVSNDGVNSTVSYRQYNANTQVTSTASFVKSGLMTPAGTTSRIDHLGIAWTGDEPTASHTANLDEWVVFKRTITDDEALNLALGTYTPPGYVARPDDLPAFPATRPGDYDPDLVWQPGVPGAWGSDYVATGGGRWQEQLVAAIKGRIYYEELT